MAHKPDVIFKCKALEDAKKEEIGLDCGDPCLLNCDFKEDYSATENGWAYCGDLILEPNPDKFITVEMAIELARRTLAEDLKRRSRFKKAGQTYTSLDKPEELTIRGILKTMRER